MVREGCEESEEAVLWVGEREVREGSRVRVGGAMGRVCYVGRVGTGPGPWVGLQWDEPGRGLHDGVAHGQRYFLASEPNSASFVRPTKLDPVCSCAEAIKHYYGEKEDESTAALHKAVIDEWKKKIKVPFIEMIGFDSVQKKQGTLDMLQEACLSDRCIWTAGDLAALCPNLEILDLSRNLLSDWTSVGDIVVQLPRLNALDLSKNLMTIPSSDEDALILSKRFPKLKKLTLTHCQLQWCHIKRVSLICQHLEEIVLAYNNITDVSIPADRMFSDSLTSLVIDGNPLESWMEVLKLGYLKNLKTLSVNACNIREIKFDDKFQDEKSDLFVNLQILYLKENLINDWRSISELNKLKKLQKFYVTKNPIFTIEDYDTCSQLIIARIGELKELNGSEIIREIRKGAEYDYLKKHGLQWKQLQVGPQKDIMEFALIHSRFNYLIEKYGVPDENLLQTKTKSWAINTNLVELTIIDESSQTIIKKKLSSTMSVQKLIALARRLFITKSKAARTSISPGLYIANVHEINNQDVYMHMDNEMKDLNYYSIQNGDTIVVRW